MSGAIWQWIAAGVIVALAVAGLVRSLRRDPCSGCTLAGHCSKKTRNTKKGCRDDRRVRP